MAVELAELAAGLPMAASFAVAGGISTLREGRRRAALNEAVHELRRPLQALALTLPAKGSEGGAADSSLHLTMAALDRLDREINGGAAAEDWELLPVRPLLAEAVDRWRSQAARTGRSLELRCHDDDAWIEGDRFSLAQAVDNLISNALLHGGGQVTIDARRDGAWLIIRVRDEGKRPWVRPRREGRLGSRGRHGHGLRVVARAARAHGGSFCLRRLGRGAEARLRLPAAVVAEGG
ncbi:MAG TPA: HAMP domain-containing sensor histidine kinase [Solirubrobacterales bacterium]|nr:HAMP domain-containing sensor histidine kinase [Solirubrobacterales bacterium]